MSTQVCDRCGGPESECPCLYVGLPLVEAAALARRNGLFPRMTCIDGQTFSVTRVGTPPRISFVVVDGLVMEASYG